MSKSRARQHYMEQQADNKANHVMAEDLKSIFNLPELESLLDDMMTDPLYREVLDTQWFKRLFVIPFLGGLSYIETKDETQSRAHHSIGVGLLAFYLSSIEGYKKKQERLFVLSGLLHDIHHLPFSHTMELALKEEGEYAPHDYDRRIISERNGNGHSSLQEIARHYKIDMDKEIFFLKPNARRPLFFRSTHNLDTLEGILRVYRKYFPEKPMAAYLPRTIIEVISSCKPRGQQGCYADTQPFDEFWRIKNQVYSDVIYDDRKVFFERVLSYYLYDLCKEKDLVKGLYRMSDVDLLEIFPSLRGKIKTLWGYIDTSSKHCDRDIVVDSDKKPVVTVNGGQPPTKLYFKTRQFNVRRQYNDIEMTRLTSLRKRYAMNTKSSVLLLDASAISNIENILDHPIAERINKIGQIKEDVLL